MNEEKTKENIKREAAQRAKELAKQRMAERLVSGNSEEKTKLESIVEVQVEGEKAEAEASATLVKQKESSSEADEKAKAIVLAKAKAVAVAKAKAAALAKQQTSGSTGDVTDEKAKAKSKAIAIAKAKGIPSKEEASIVEKVPSPNQPYLDKYVTILKEQLGQEIFEDTYINPLSKDVPTLFIKREHYGSVAKLLRSHEHLHFDYLSEIHGTDFVTHMEVYAHLYSYKNRQSVAIKVKADRDNPVVDSVTPIWEGANWPERETYDLLGIIFTNHPKLERILLPDDWVGYPLRKDYEPFDVEV